jgi:hypothetical protein
MAFPALASDFSPFVHHPSFLLKSDRTPSPPSHIRRDFGSPRSELDLDGMEGAYNRIALHTCSI